MEKYVRTSALSEGVRKQVNDEIGKLLKKIKMFNDKYKEINIITLGYLD